MALAPTALQFIADETHRAAEEHWRRHRSVPTKAILISKDDRPELVDFTRGISFNQAETLIVEHAARVDAYAVAFTSMAWLAEVVQGRTELALADLGDARSQRCVATAAAWPDRRLAVIRLSAIEQDGTN